MSEDKKKVESELRANKLDVIHLLADQLVAMKYNEYKDFKMEDSKPLAYYDATIDILKKTVENAKLTEAKTVKFDKLEQERKNLTPEQMKDLQEQQEKINKRVDSYLATMEPRASLRGNIQMPNNIIIRYRGKGVNDSFLQRYPFGVLM